MDEFSDQLIKESLKHVLLPFKQPYNKFLPHRIIGNLCHPLTAMRKTKPIFPVSIGEPQPGRPIRSIRRNRIRKRPKWRQTRVS